MPMLPCTFETNNIPPWFISVAGGKRPKAKAKTKPIKKKDVDPPGDNADDVIEIMQNRFANAPQFTEMYGEDISSFPMRT